MPAPHELPVKSKRPRKREADLLDAAERLFLEKGIVATSVDEIVAAANVAKGTFYLYFKTKENVVGALQRRFIFNFHEKLQEAMAKHRPESYQLRLKTWVETAVSTFLSQIDLHNIVFHECKPEESQPLNENLVIAQFMELLSQGKEAGIWQVEDVRTTAIMLFHALHGALDDAVEQGDADARKLSRIVMAFFERALQGHS